MSRISSSLCTALVLLASADAFAGQGAHAPKALPDGMMIAAAIPGPIVDPNAAVHYRPGPVVPVPTIAVRPPEPVALSHGQVLELVATKLSPPQSGLLADLFRSTRPMAAAFMPASSTANAVDVAALPKARREMNTAER